MLEHANSTHTDVARMPDLSCSIHAALETSYRWATTVIMWCHAPRPTAFFVLQAFYQTHCMKYRCNVLTSCCFSPVSKSRARAIGKPFVFIFDLYRIESAAFYGNIFGYEQKFIQMTLLAFSGFLEYLTSERSQGRRKHGGSGGSCPPALVARGQHGGSECPCHSNTTNPL